MTHPDAGFHEGELAVQERAGVRAEAARLAPMMEPAELRHGLVRFLGDRTFAALTASDRTGRLWVSALSGPPGFLTAADPHRLDVRTAPGAGDPLQELTVPQPAGLVAIDYAGRRRVRINGTLVRADADGLAIAVQQAYGNCPQYIHPRTLAPVQEHAPSTGRRGTSLSASDIAQIRAADTFFIGSRHPARGSDSSHRGGPAGFVRIDDERHLSWPDYAGNNMFNSLGNLAVDPRAALLFPDFRTGRTLQLSGSAVVDWLPSGSAEDDGLTGRRVRFTIETSVAAHLLRVRTGP